MLLQMILVSYSVAVFITYNTQFYVAAKVSWLIIFQSSGYLQNLSNDIVNQTDQKKSFFTPETKLNSIENLFRIALVALTFLLALSIPKIELFINLVGAVPSTLLAIIIPPILDVTVFWHQDKSIFRLIKNMFIFMFGIYILVPGTTLSVNDIIKYLSKV